MQKPTILDLSLLGLTMTILLLSTVSAGTLDSPATPADTASAMYGTEDIYNRVHTGARGGQSPTAFGNPTAGPGPTGKTINEIMAEMPTADNTNGASPSHVKAGATYWGLRTDGGWGLRSGTLRPAQVAKSGQTLSYAANDDGAKQQGVAWPTPRFTDPGNGTITDNLTGLIWLKNVSCFTARSWSTALTAAATLNSGECGLTDGSAEGGWRLPQVRELQSLLDKGRGNPALPLGHPFTGAPTGSAWSSTTLAGTTANAWYVSFANGVVSSSAKTNSNTVWPVRGGQ